jgi:hypothetical protein
MLSGLDVLPRLNTLSYYPAFGSYHHELLSKHKKYIDSSKKKEIKKKIDKTFIFQHIIELFFSCKLEFGMIIDQDEILTYMHLMENARQPSTTLIMI